VTASAPHKSRLEFGEVGGIIACDSDGGCGVKWFFLMSFVAGLAICAFLVSLIIFTFATRGVGGARVVLALSLQLLLFGWAAREMFRSFKGIRLND
jgi:hypothetical protein